MPGRFSQPLQARSAQCLRYRLNLAAESGEVVKRLDTRKEEIGAALYGRESGKALYLSSDWPLRDRHVVAAVLSSDHRIAFIAYSWKFGSFIQTFCANSNWRTRLAQITNAAIPRSTPSSGAPSAKARRMSLRDGSFCAAGYSRPCHVDLSAEYASQRGSVTLGDRSSRS